MLHTLGKQRRKARISMGIRGTDERPRLSVFKSNSSMQAQIINDAKQVTLLGVSEKHVDSKGTKTEKAKALGLKLAEMAKKAKITKVVFDKGPFRYHGRVKAFAEAAREGGLDF